MERKGSIDHVGSSEKMTRVVFSCQARRRIFNQFFSCLYQKSSLFPWSKIRDFQARNKRNELNEAIGERKALFTIIEDYIRMLKKVLSLSGVLLSSLGAAQLSDAEKIPASCLVRGPFFGSNKLSGTP